MKKIALIFLILLFHAPVNAQESFKTAKTNIQSVFGEIRQEIKNKTPSGVCYAGDFRAFSSCLKNNTRIVLTNNILLDEGQFFQIKNLRNIDIDGGAQKFGFDETPARFTKANKVSERLSADGGVYFFVDNSNNISFRNISFHSAPSQGPFCAKGEPKHLEDACRGQIWVRSSANVSVLGSLFDARKKFQLHVIGVDGFLFSGNTFTGASTYALAFGPMEMGNKNGRVTKNTFTKAGANGIIGSDLQNVSIDNNLFQSNHMLTQFYGYGGGQIDITTSTQRSGTFNVKILNNAIIAGESHQSHGVEFSNLTSTLNPNLPVNNIEVAYNYIEGNAHQGIKFEDFRPDSVGRNIYIHHNTLKDNNNPGVSALVLANHPVFASDNTTVYSKLGYESTQSFLGRDFSCVLKGKDTCAFRLMWKVTSKTARDVLITVRYADKVGDHTVRTVFAKSSGNGAYHQTATWITKRPVVFEMYDALDYERNPQVIWATPLAQIVVFARD